MQIIEFFFTNFWHWLGLVIIVAIIFGRELIVIKKKD